MNQSLIPPFTGAEIIKVNFKGKAIEKGRTIIANPRANIGDKAKR
jgi:hypothetical protein